MGATLRVATYNLYLGADLSLVFGVADEHELGERLLEVADQLGSTAFPLRAPSLARVIAEHRPDLVGLQEACTWSVDGEELWDFGPILLAELEALGTPYDLVASIPTFTGSGDVPEGPAPGAATVRFDMVGANAVLHRRDSPFAVHAPRSGLFTEALQLDTTPGTDIAIVRGWCAVDVTGPDGERAVFVDTHTEAYEQGSRDRQRDELLAALDALDGGGRLVLVGDLNAPPDLVGLPDDLTDAWAEAHPDGLGSDRTGGATCGQHPALRNEQSQLSDRIDYVLVRGLEVVDAFRAGHREVDFKHAGRWPSDHAAVLADLVWPETGD